MTRVSWLDWNSNLRRYRLPWEEGVKDPMWSNLPWVGGATPLPCVWQETEESAWCLCHMPNMRGSLCSEIESFAVCPYKPLQYWSKSEKDITEHWNFKSSRFSHFCRGSLAYIIPTHPLRTLETLGKSFVWECLWKHQRSPGIYKQDKVSPEIGFVPATQGWFNIWKLM